MPQGVASTPSTANKMNDFVSRSFAFISKESARPRSHEFTRAFLWSPVTKHNHSQALILLSTLDPASLAYGIAPASTTVRKQSLLLARAENTTA